MWKWEILTSRRPPPVPGGPVQPASRVSLLTRKQVSTACPPCSSPPRRNHWRPCPFPKTTNPRLLVCLILLFLILLFLPQSRFGSQHHHRHHRQPASARHRPNPPPTSAPRVAPSPTLCAPRFRPRPCRTRTTKRQHKTGPRPRAPKSGATPPEPAFATQMRLPRSRRPRARTRTAHPSGGATGSTRSRSSSGRTDNSGCTTGLSGDANPPPIHGQPSGSTRDTHVT